MALEQDDRPLFGKFVSDPPIRKKLRVIHASIAVHVIAAVAVFLVPVFLPGELPETRDAIRALLYDPPPPPPPPLPTGSPLVKQAQEVKPTTPEQKPDPEKLTAPDETPKEAEIKPEAKVPEDQQAGVADGSDLGTLDGMEGGEDGGEVGGIPGGVLGGILGGTGDVVADYDQPPRPITMGRPVYPHDAFIKKVEGTVHVEYVIDVDGRVRRARVVKSVPVLDAAALAAARQWVFHPALKHGKPVATKHVSPISFRIF